jgi:hypothetical protein
MDNAAVRLDPSNLVRQTLRRGGSARGGLCPDRAEGLAAWLGRIAADPVEGRRVR